MIHIYKASAGSGKTFTLAREYIKLILGTKDEDGKYHLNFRKPGAHKAVLAITFTNKATEEMKGRIIHELAVIAGCEKGWDMPSPYEKDLCGTFNCTSAELSAAAMNALRDLLYDFNSFSISTIDSFFQTVLRSFAHEAEVSGSYDVEIDDSSVISMSVDQMLQNLNHGRPDEQSRYLIHWLTSFMTRMIEEGRSFNVFNRASKVHEQLIRFIGNITDDTFRENETAIMNYLHDPSRFAEFKKCVEGLSGKIRRTTAGACSAAYGVINANPGLKGIINTNIVNPIGQWAKNGYYVAPAKSYASLGKTIQKGLADIESIYKAKQSASPLRTPEIDSIISEALHAMDESCRRIKMLRLISANIYQFGLMSSLVEIMERFRRENSTILLSDTNSLLSKIIGDEDSPFLYEKVGLRYNHYLIDEFQDTSFSQWQNLRPLVAESLAADHDNLVIGDVKQCIYRFRNSDPTLLHGLHDEPFAHGRALTSGESIRENTNWRSSAEVVRFNNSLFSAIAYMWGFDDIYGNVAQQISSKHLSHHGYVRVETYESANGGDTSEAALATLASQLRRQLESGYRPGDIAILVRRWSEGESVIRYLEKVRSEDPSFPHFNIVSDSSLVISRSPAVALVVSRLRVLAATDYSSGKNKRTRKEIAKILNDFEASLSKCGNPSDALNTAVSHLDSNGEDSLQNGDLSVSATGTDLISLIESIIANDIPAPYLHTDNVFITAFQDLVCEFVGKGRADIRSFLQWWDDKGSHLSVSGSNDSSSLTILTIHKSKGLEFPCVHIPFAEFNSGNHSEVAWFKLPEIADIPGEVLPPMMPLTISDAMDDTPFSAQYQQIKRERLLDSINLLYVAFTRAVDELIIGLKVTSADTAVTSEPDKMPRISRIIFSGINMCTADFCRGLEKNCEFGQYAVSPFVPMAIESGGVFEIGTHTQKKVETKHGNAMRPSAMIEMEDYPITSHPSLWDNTALASDRLNHLEIARERGLILHDLMAQIRTPADIDGVLFRARSTPDFRRLDNAEITGLHEIVTKRVTDRRVEEWFEGYTRLLIERPVMTVAGEAKRFDRVVWTRSGEIHLIDYKSGSQPPKRYIRQIKGYMEFLCSMGYHGVRGFLYYLDSGEIIEIEH